MMAIIIDFEKYKERSLGCPARTRIPLWVYFWVHPCLWFLYAVPCAEEEDRTV